ncbi:MAG: hypothetical protein Q3985_05995 [Eubacteriales bacterium]|nr:hypothetical protein [Eubacteriales bacterium]
MSVDYRKMYYTLFRSTEKAINDLIAAQQVCEDIFVETCDEEIAQMREEEKRWQEQRKHGTE